MPVKRPTKKMLLEDLEWAHNRLDHLLTIAKEECWNKGDFSGPMETMVCVSEFLPKIRERYKFKQAWPNGRTKNAHKI